MRLRRLRSMKLRLGARGSALSLVQADARRGRALAPRAEVEIVTSRRRATGSRRPGRRSAGRATSPGSSTRRCSTGRIDLRGAQPQGRPLRPARGARARRRSPARGPAATSSSRGRGVPFAELPRGARVGTASPRRRAQLLAARPDLRDHRGAGQRRHPAPAAARGALGRDRPRAGRARAPGPSRRGRRGVSRRSCCPRWGRGRSRSSRATVTRRSATRSPRSTMRCRTPRRSPSGDSWRASRRAVARPWRRGPAWPTGNLTLDGAVFAADGSGRCAERRQDPRPRPRRSARSWRGGSSPREPRP